MALLIMILLSLSSTCFSYPGENEVEELYGGFDDLNDPTLKDYRALESFLRLSERPYLDLMKGSNDDEIEKRIYRRTCKGLMFVGHKDEMPLFEVHHLGQGNANRCVLLFSSYNAPYPQMLRRTLDSIRGNGFSGDVLVRIGGYPWLDSGGIQFAHIPYSWKVAFIGEALDLGYEEILYLDTSMIPLNNLNGIFDIIRNNGYLFCASGICLNYGHSFGHHLDEAIEANEVGLEDLDKIPHLISAIVGIHSKHQGAMDVFSLWLDKTKEVLPCMNWYPEELPFSVAAWKKGLVPILHWGDITCTQENFHYRDCFPKWSFLIDLNRE